MAETGALRSYRLAYGDVCRRDAAGGKHPSRGGFVVVVDKIVF